MSSPRRSISGPARAGHTLVELVLGMAVTSILMVAIGSAIMLAGGAIPRANDPAIPTEVAWDVAYSMAAELQFALSFIERTNKAVEFTVPDRDGDAIPEVIRYEWSGILGDPVQRWYNGGTAVNVIDSVVDFELGYDTTSHTETLPDEILSLELELISYDSATDLGAASVQSVSPWGQYFQPTLPANTIEWSITGVKFLAAEGTSPSSTTIELRRPAADLTPDGTVLDTATLNPAELTPVYTWIEKSLTAKNLSPGDGLWLTFTTSAGSSAQLRYQTGFVTQPNIGLVEGTPAWGPLQTDQSLLFYVYGKHRTSTTDVDTRTYLTGVAIDIETGSVGSSEIETRIALFHRSEIHP